MAEDMEGEEKGVSGWKGKAVAFAWMLRWLEWCSLLACVCVAPAFAPAARSAEAV